MTLNAQFLFHPIGQGCFYSGLIYSETNKLFSFVYDCGSNSPRHFLNDEIDRFKKLLDGNLDLLIISHFDADHVNGVSQLLKEVRCRRLVIPYISQEERLLMYVNAEIATEEYRRMLQDPVRYFTSGNEFRIDEVVVIDGPDDPENRDIDVTPFTPTVIYEDSGDTSELYVNHYSVDLAVNRKQELVQKERNLANANFKYVYTPFAFRSRTAGWEFAFYVKKFDKVLLFSKFKADVDQLLKAKGINLFQIFDDEHVSELKELYRLKVSSNLNNTSLVTYHGPLFSLRSKGQTKVFRNLFKRNFKNPLPNNFYLRPTDGRYGTLLTGDIDINGPRKSKKMTDYFRHYLDKVLVFQVPHHGSRHNWYVTKISPLHNFKEYIINHGVGRLHHPGIEVVQDIQAKCKAGTVHHNNENDCFFYSFYIPVKISRKILNLIGQLFKEDIKKIKDNTLHEQ